MKKIAVILSGCGVYDGSEIHEAVMSLWALSKHDISYECFAPDKNQYHVINHLTGNVANETRNLLVESARIARSKIKALTDLKVNDFDGVLFPGGHGAAKNLSSYGYEGENYTVDKEVEKVLREFHSAKKVIVALCIAPMIVAKVLGAKLTIGTDAKIAKIVEHVGAKHENKNYDEISFDEDNLVITTPCYMLAENIYQISLGIEAAIVKMKEILK